jgi:hypothetical protein
MHAASFIRWTLVVMTSACALLSCKKSAPPTGPAGRTEVTMQVIPLVETPSIIDSTLFHRHVYSDWHGPFGGLDTSRADSVANWLAGTSYPITDMWFPNSVSRCLSPFPENIVIIRLSVTDTTIKSLGFLPTNSAFGPCFLYYRHYTFTHTSAGP